MMKLIKVTNPTDADIKYAQKIIEQWGKHSGFVLPPNIEIVSIPRTGLFRNWGTRFRDAFPNW